MAAFRRLAQRHEILGFFILTYIFSWSLGIYLALQAVGWCEPHIPLWLHYLYAFGPALAAFVMTYLTTGAQGIRELLGRVFKWRVNWTWWVAAFSPLWLYALIALFQGIALGEWVDLRLLGQVNFLPQLNLGAALLLWVLTFGLGEEIGWRGYALPRMQRNRSAISATLILALLWALWHWPQFFYVLDPAILPGWLFALTAGTIVFTWLYNSSHGSVFIIILWHGFFDFITASKAGEGTTAMIMSIFVMVWAVLVVILYKPASLSPENKHTV
jgi:membrane protease YdiL (CAAX protease family)